MTAINYLAADNLNQTPVSIAQPLPVTMSGSGAANSNTNPTFTQAAAKSPLGYQQITATSSSVGFAIPSTSTTAVVTVEAQAVRWRDDGTAPTATVGMPIAVGQTYTFNGAADLAAVRFIAQTAGAIINVSYYA